MGQTETVKGFRHNGVVADTSTTSPHVQMPINTVLTHSKTTMYEIKKSSRHYFLTDPSIHTFIHSDPSILSTKYI